MKTFSIRKYKSPLELVEAPIPAIGPNDALVKISAASVNQLDEMLRVGTFKAMLPYKMPLTLGNDFAGVISAVGANVTRFKVGDRVYAKPNQARIGTFAEYIAVDHSDLAFVPNSVSIAEAASLPLVALTAWQALVVKGNLKPGQKVLIQGGAGGVGSIAIQLAKSIGAYVATTVGTKNVEFAKELGADRVIDYKTQNFSDLVSDYDLVLDTQGGETLMKSLRVLRKGGKTVGIAGPPDMAYANRLKLNPLLKLVVKALSSKVIRQASGLGVQYEFLFVEAGGEQLSKVTALIDSKTIKPVLTREYAFEDTASALADLVSGKISRGKAVVLVDSAEKK
jgi:NADPH:quinone reductase-like Zn-dependent oxidoreductase